MGGRVGEVVRRAPLAGAAGARWAPGVIAGGGPTGRLRVGTLAAALSAALARGATGGVAAPSA